MKSTISIALYIGLFLQCSTAQHPSWDELPGEYAYAFPNGMIELLEINNDGTFSQRFYADSATLKSDFPPTKVNFGEWQECKDGIRLEYFLSYCKLLDPKEMLEKPELCTISCVTWTFLSKSHARILLFYSATNYFYVKQTR
jgi:hypothetical protein